MEPKVKAGPFIPQDDIGTLKVNLESSSIESFTSSRGIWHHISYTCHEYVYHDPCDQFAPPTSPSHSLDYQVVSLNCNQIQDNHVTLGVEEESEDTFDLSSLFQIPPY